MKNFLLPVLLCLLSPSLIAQSRFEVGIKATRERISYMDLSRVAAVPARTQDLNMGFQVLHHLNKRIAFIGGTSYCTHRYFGTYQNINLLTHDLPSNVALMEVQSLEALLAVRLKFLNSLAVRPFVTAAVSQFFITSFDFPKHYVINQSLFVDDLPDLRPQAYNLAVSVMPGLRYHAHEYLSVDFEPLLKWYVIGNTSYGDQLGLGWSASLNYKLGK